MQAPPFNNYVEGDSLTDFEAHYGEFTWEKYSTYKTQTPVKIHWESLENSIVQQLLHPPQKYFKVFRASGHKKQQKKKTG
jgi:hypothetical protein